MRDFVYKIFVNLGMILSFLYPQTLTRVWHSFRDKVYTGFVKRRFAKFGKSIVMWHPYQLRGLEYIEVGDNTILEKDLQLTVTVSSSQKPCITIGNHCLIRRGTHITACNHITIGNHLLTGTNVLITDNSHGSTDYASLLIPPGEREVVSKGPVTIGNRVWLGNNVCVLPGVTIGDGAVVGANSVVTCDVPAFSVVAGIPAKLLRQKND